MEGETDRKGHLLSLVLADSELERVPEQFRSHPCVVSNAKKRKKRPSRVLLDSSLHHPLFRGDGERNRRGRPDIVHQFMMIGLESMLSIDGDVRLYVHTRNDEMIEISPDTRIPKNQVRFFGLLEELFRSGKVPDRGDPLLRLTPEMTLKDVIENAKGNRPDSISVVWLLDEEGEMVDPYVEMENLISGADHDVHMICILGGFPSGGYRTEVLPLNRRIAIHRTQMKSWAVEMELLCGFRRALITGNRTSGGA